MPKETMTPKERWLAVLQRQKPDRVPTDYWGTPEINQKMMEHMGCASFREMMKLLHIDNPVSVGPRYVGPAIPLMCLVCDMLMSILALAFTLSRFPIRWRNTAA